MTNKPPVSSTGISPIRKEGIYHLALDASLSLTERAFLFNFFIFCEDDGTLTIKSKDLFTIIGCSRHTFWRTIKKLRDKKLVFYENTLKDPSGIIKIQVKDYHYFVSNNLVKKRQWQIKDYKKVDNTVEIKKKEGVNSHEIFYQRKYLLNGKKKTVFKEIKREFFRRTGKYLSDELVKQLLEKELYTNLLEAIRRLNFSKYNGDPIGALCGYIKNPEAYEFLSEEAVVKQERELNRIKPFQWLRRCLCI